jgi:hypothetical protein
MSSRGDISGDVNQQGVTPLEPRRDGDGGRESVEAERRRSRIRWMQVPETGTQNKERSNDDKARVGRSRATNGKMNEQTNSQRGEELITSHFPVVNH